MKSKIIFVLLLFLIQNSFARNHGWINVVEEGADNTGVTLSTEAIKVTIEKVTKMGGGTVYFPAGEYLTGPIHMLSNTTLYLDTGAVIKFSNDFDLYTPFVKTRWEGTVMMNFSPLIYAYEQENIAITGRGIIDGQGREWWRYYYNNKENPDIVPKHKWFDEWGRLNEDLVTEDYYQSTMKWRFFRPPMIQFFKCNNILIEGVTLTMSPFWTINPAFSENIVIEGVTVINPPSPNTDGINPSSCRNVRISNCYVSVGDDCITIKSGRDIDGRKWAVPSENITITNCTLLRGNGGVVIGSEVSGDVRNVTISNCVFDGTKRGIRLKSARGRGGVVEDIRVNNIVMRDVKDQAIVFNLFYDKSEEEPITERTPVFRDIHISNVSVEGAKNACNFYGISEMPIQNLTFNNINIKAETGFVVNTGMNIELHNVDVSVKKGASFIFENSSGLVLNNIKTQYPLPDTPVISFEQVSNAFIYNSFPLVETDRYLEVSGSESKNIFMQNNVFHNVKIPVFLNEEVDANAIIKK